MRVPRFTLGVFIGLSLGAGTLDAQGRTLTVERIYSAPSLSGATPRSIQWAPDGKVVTFLQDTAGGNVLDLWQFDLATRRTAILVRASELTRGAEQEFSPEELAARERRRQTSRGITAYHRSGAANKILFPYSGDLYVYDLGDRSVSRLTRTPAAELDPKWSPDGRYVAFVRDGDLYTMELASGREIRLTTGATDKVRYGVAEFIAQEEMGRYTGYWWAPDSRRIAFLETDDTKLPVFVIPDYVPERLEETKQEYPRAGDPNTVVRVGVVGLQGGAPAWLKLETGPDAYVPRVDWLPDSRTLTVQRQNRGQDTLQLMFFDVRTGSGRVVLTETDSAWVNLNDDFTPLDGGRRFLWTSERDGFRQIYVYDQSGRRTRQVTTERWDVDAVEAVDEDRGLVYFTGRGEGPFERHLYAIGLDGTGLRRLTRDAGWHGTTVGPAFDHFVDTFSDRARPPTVAIRDISGRWVGWVAENRVPELIEYGLRSTEFFTVPAADGTPLNAQAIKPAGFNAARRYPVLIYAYAGPQSQLVVDRWSGDRYLWHQLLAQRGVVVVTFDNRGTDGRGRDFRRAMFRRLGDVEVADQIAAARWLARQPWVDSTRIGIWGWSYGGYATLMAMIAGDGLFRMGVAVAPVTDWRAYDTHYTERFMRLPRENAAAYDHGSPLKRAGELKGHLLLIHGDADDNVHYQQTHQLVKALQDAGRQFRFMVYPQKLHSLAGADTRIHLFTMITDFVEEQLVRGPATREAARGSTATP